MNSVFNRSGGILSVSPVSVSNSWGSGILSAPEFTRACWSGYDPSSSHLYNTRSGENRPVRWTKGNTVITMSYDRMGRRVTKNDQCFVYDGYLQIANFHSQPQPLSQKGAWREPVELKMRTGWTVAAIIPAGLVGGLGDDSPRSDYLHRSLIGKIIYMFLKR